MLRLQIYKFIKTINSQSKLKVNKCFVEFILTLYVPLLHGLLIV